MKRLAGAAVLLALAASVAAAGASREPLLGARWVSGGFSIARYDPDTLRPAGAPLRLRVPAAAWSWAPDRSSVALAGGDVSSGAAVAVVEAAPLRRRFRVALPELRIQGVAWTSAGRLLVVGWTGSVTRVLALDPASGRRIASVDVAGVVMAGEAAGGRLVLLVAPEQRIAAARLALVDASLRVRTIALARIPAGSRALPAKEAGGDQYATRIRQPGLALDPAGRAFVVDADGLVAVVDLPSGRLGYRRAVERETASVSKSVAGADVRAVWLGGGRLAVTGARYSGVDPATRLIRSQPLGLALVDTRTWTRRVVQPDVSFFTRTGRWLVAWDAQDVRWFDLAGRERGRLERLGEQALDVAVAGDRALVGGYDGRPSRLVDLRSGRILGRAPGPPPLLLVAATSPIR